MSLTKQAATTFHQNIRSRLCLGGNVSPPSLVSWMQSTLSPDMRPTGPSQLKSYFSAFCCDTIDRISSETKTPPSYLEILHKSEAPRGEPRAGNLVPMNLVPGVVWLGSTFADILKWRTSPPPTTTSTTPPPHPTPHSITITITITQPHFPCRHTHRPYLNSPNVNAFDNSVFFFVACYTQNRQLPESESIIKNTRFQKNEDVLLYP